MERKDHALVEVGYIYTFIISAILMSAMLLVTSNMMVDADDRTSRKELEAIADYTVAAFEDVKLLAVAHPNAQFQRSITLPSLHNGIGYSIEFADEELTFYFAGGLAFTRETIASGIPIAEEYDSLYGSGDYLIIYNPDLHVIEIKATI